MVKKNKKNNYNYFIVIIILLTLGYSFTKKEKKDSTIELLENSKEGDILKLNLILVARSTRTGKAYTTSDFFPDCQGKQYTIVNVGVKENITVFEIEDTQTLKGSFIGSELFYDRDTNKIFICIQDGSDYGNGLYGYIIKGELTYSNSKWSGGGAYYAANRSGWTKNGVRQWQPAPMASANFTIAANNLIKYSGNDLSPPAFTQPNMPVDGSYLIARIQS